MEDGIHDGARINDHRCRTSMCSALEGNRGLLGAESCMVGGVLVHRVRSRSLSAWTKRARARRRWLV
jgi:hypothetical protein